MDVLSPWIAGALGLLLFTSFVKCLTVLSITRYGLGLHGIGFGMVTLTLALALSLVVMYPIVKEGGGYGALLSAPHTKQAEFVEQRLLPFMDRHGDPDLRDRLGEIFAPAAAAERQSGSTELTVAAFIIAEVQRGFGIGFLILVPLLVIDLLVAHGLSLLGVSHLPSGMIAVPLKILLIVTVNGWVLISEKLLFGYL